MSNDLSNDCSESESRSVIYKLKKETETLRTIMKGYIHTIDSLNTLNVTLTNTLSEKNIELNKVTSENENIKTQNIELQETVAVGSILQTMIYSLSSPKTI